MIDLWLPPKPAIIRQAEPELIKANFLPGWFPAGAAVATPPPSLEFLQFTEDTVDRTTYTFTSQNLGAADATRRIVVCCMWSDGSTATTITSANIAGIAATIHVASDNDIQGNCAIFSALVPTGTSGTITFTVTAGGGGSVDRGAIAVYRALNETVASPNATASDTTISSKVLSVTVNIPVNGWVVA